MAFSSKVPKYFKDMNPNNIRCKDIETKWSEVGMLKCDCHHENECTNCYGDGRCLNCEAYGGHGPRKNMCDTWRFSGYYTRPAKKKVRFELTEQYDDFEDYCSEIPDAEVWYSALEQRMTFIRKKIARSGLELYYRSLD
jgi:hypothetical protein